jgi:hypothetical protein
MSGYSPIRKALTAMVVLAILLWAEAGLALVAGDRVMACHAMMLSGQAGTMSAADDAATAQQEPAMACCPEGPANAPAMSQNHPPCCSVSNDAERPLAFLVSSERTTPHPLSTAAATVGTVVGSPAHYVGELQSADAPHFVKPILELKTDLRI